MKRELLYMLDLSAERWADWFSKLEDPLEDRELEAAKQGVIAALGLQPVDGTVRVVVMANTWGNHEHTCTETAETRLWYPAPPCTEVLPWTGPRVVVDQVLRSAGERAAAIAAVQAIDLADYRFFYGPNDAHWSRFYFEHLDWLPGNPYREPWPYVLPDADWSLGMEEALNVLGPPPPRSHGDSVTRDVCLVGRFAEHRALPPWGHPELETESVRLSTGEVRDVRERTVPLESARASLESAVDHLGVVALANENLSSSGAPWVGWPKFYRLRGRATKSARVEYTVNTFMGDIEETLSISPGDTADEIMLNLANRISTVWSQACSSAPPEDQPEFGCNKLRSLAASAGGWIEVYDGLLDKFDFPELSGSGLLLDGPLTRTIYSPGNGYSARANSASIRYFHGLGGNDGSFVFPGDDPLKEVRPVDVKHAVASCIGDGPFVRAVEVSQGLQTWNHDVELIEGKEAYVSVFLEGRDLTPFEEVRLRVFDCDDSDQCVPLQGVRETVGRRQPQVPGDAADFNERRKLDARAVFHLTASEAVGRKRFVPVIFENWEERAELDCDDVVGCSEAVSFVPAVVPELRVTPILLEVRGHPEFDGDEGDLKSELQHLEWQLPLPKLPRNHSRRLTVGLPPHYRAKPGGDLEWSAEATNRAFEAGQHFLVYLGYALAATRRTECRSLGEAGCQPLGVSSLGVNIPTKARGVSLGSGTFVVNQRRSRTGVAARSGFHEFSHSMGLHHVPFCMPENNAASCSVFPYVKDMSLFVANQPEFDFDGGVAIPLDDQGTSLDPYKDRPLLGPLSFDPSDGQGSSDDVKTEYWGFDARPWLQAGPQMVPLDPRLHFDAMSYCSFYGGHCASFGGSIVSSGVAPDCGWTWGSAHHRNVLTRELTGFAAGKWRGTPRTFCDPGLCAPQESCDDFKRGPYDGSIAPAPSSLAGTVVFGTMDPDGEVVFSPVALEPRFGVNGLPDVQGEDDTGFDVVPVLLDASGEPVGGEVTASVYLARAGDSFDLPVVEVFIPQGALDGVALLQLVDAGGEVLGELSVAASAPDVEVTWPAPGVVLGMGEVPVEVAVGAGLEEDTYLSLEYSTDGGMTWEYQSFGVRASDGVELDTTSIPGSTDAYIRVTASRGARAVAEEVGPFTVPGHEPVVEIVEPRAEASVRTEGLVVLEGVYRDREDGIGSGQSIAWASDLDGQLGVGTLTLPASDLTPGVHVITATAVDDDGMSGSATVQIEIIDESSRTVDEFQAGVTISGGHAADLRSIDVVIGNFGSMANSSNIGVEFAIDTALEVVAANSEDGTCQTSPDGQRVVCTVQSGVLPPGYDTSLQLFLRASSTVNGISRLGADVTVTHEEFVREKRVEWTLEGSRTPRTQKADAAIGLRGLGDQLAPSSMSYEVAVANVGASTLEGGVWVDGDIPPGAALLSVTGAGWSCRVGDLDFGCGWEGSVMGGAALTPIVVGIELLEGAAPLLTFAAELSSQADSELRNNRSVRTVSTVGPSPNVVGADLALEVTHASARGDGTFSFASDEVYATIRNVGEFDWSDALVVEVQLPNGFAFDGVREDGWSCDAGSGVVQCTHSTIGLAAQALRSLTLQVTPPAEAGPWSLWATLVSSDAWAGNDAAQVVLPGVHSEGLVLTAKAAPEVPRFGDVVETMVQVSYRAEAVLDEVRVGYRNDGMPPYEYAGWSCGDGWCTFPGPVAEGEDLPPLLFRAQIGNEFPVATRVLAGRGIPQDGGSWVEAPDAYIQWRVEPHAYGRPLISRDSNGVLRIHQPGMPSDPALLVGTKLGNAFGSTGVGGLSYVRATDTLIGYAPDSPSGDRLAWVPVATRESSAPHAPADVVLDPPQTRNGRAFSPDAMHMVYSYYGELYVVPLHGGPSELLLARTEAGGFYEPAWSPDGSQLVFAYKPDRSAPRALLYGISMRRTSDGGWEASSVPARALNEAEVCLQPQWERACEEADSYGIDRREYSPTWHPTDGGLAYLAADTPAASEPYFGAYSLAPGASAEVEVAGPTEFYLDTDILKLEWSPEGDHLLLVASRDFGPVEGFILKPGAGLYALGEVRSDITWMPNLDRRASPDALTVQAPGIGIVNVLDNDAEGAVLGHYSQPAHGSVVCGSDGECEYWPAAGFAGRDAFSYTVYGFPGQSVPLTTTVEVAVEPASVVALELVDGAGAEVGTALVVEGRVGGYVPSGPEHVVLAMVQVWDSSDALDTNGDGLNFTAADDVDGDGDVGFNDCAVGGALRVQDQLQDLPGTDVAVAWMHLSIPYNASSVSALDGVAGSANFDVVPVTWARPMLEAEEAIFAASSADADGNGLADVREALMSARTSSFGYVGAQIDWVSGFDDLHPVLDEYRELPRHEGNANGHGYSLDSAIQSIVDILSTRPAGERRVAHLFGIGDVAVSTGAGSPLDNAVRNRIEIHTHNYFSNRHWGFVGGVHDGSCDDPTHPYAIVARQTGGRCSHEFDLGAQACLPHLASHPVSNPSMDLNRIESVTVAIDGGEPVPLDLAPDGSFRVSVGEVQSGPQTVVVEVRTTDGSLLRETRTLYGQEGFNQDPVTAIDEGLVVPGGWTSVDVLANDGDADGDSLRIVGANITRGEVYEGSASVDCDAQGACVIRVSSEQRDAIEFTYLVSDGRGGEAVGRCTVAVARPNGAPMSRGLHVVGSPGDVMVLPVSALAIDREGDALSIIAEGQSDLGAFVLCDAQQCEYEVPDLIGSTDTLSVSIADGAQSIVATATVEIVPPASERGLAGRWVDPWPLEFSPAAQTLEFELVNTGLWAEGTDLTFSLSGVELFNVAGVGWDCELAGGSAFCRGDDVLPGSSTNLLLTVRAYEPGQTDVSGLAVSSSDGARYPLFVPIEQRATVEVDLRGPTNVRAGLSASFQVEVKNTGNLVANDVAVTINSPLVLELNSGSPWDCHEEGSEFVCSLATSIEPLGYGPWIYLQGVPRLEHYPSFSTTASAGNVDTLTTSVEVNDPDLAPELDLSTPYSCLENVVVLRAVNNSPAPAFSSFSIRYRAPAGFDVVDVRPFAEEDTACTAMSEWVECQTQTDVPPMGAVAVASIAVRPNAIDGAEVAHAAEVGITQDLDPSNDSATFLQTVQAFGDVAMAAAEAGTALSGGQLGGQFMEGNTIVGECVESGVERALAFVRFDLTQLAFEPTIARLRAGVFQAGECGEAPLGGPTMAVHRLNEPMPQGTTWSTLPSYDSEPLYHGQVATDLDVDISQLVSEWRADPGGNFGLVVLSDDPAASLSADGFGAPPELTLGYDTDVDADGVAVCVDNCPTAFNPGQEDADADGEGDVCEAGYVDYALEKIAVGSFEVGVASAYELVISNVGTRLGVSPVAVLDTIPAGLEILAAPECTVDGQEVNCVPLQPLEPGESGTFRVDVMPTPAAVGHVVNTAVVASEEDADPDNDAASAETTVTGIVDLALDMTAVGSFAIGEASGYELAVSNVGSLPTSLPATVVDDVPEGLEILAAAGCAVEGQRAECSIPAGLWPGQTVVFQLEVVPTEAALGSVTNAATLTSLEDAHVSNNSASAVATVTGVVDLELIQTVEGAFAVGDEGVFALRVTNVGTRATKQAGLVVDQVPTGLVVADAPGCTVEGQQVSCVVPSGLEVDGSVSFELTVVPEESAVGSVANEASVSSPEDENAENDTTTVQVEVTGVVDLGIAQRVVGDWVEGVLSVLHVEVSNAGTVTAQQHTVEVTLPSAVGVVSGSGDGYGCTVGGGEVHCSTTDPISPGTTQQLVLEVIPDAAAVGTLVTAAAVDTAADQDPSNNTSTLEVLVEGRVDVALQVTAVGEFKVGEVSTVEAVVNSVGTADTIGVTTLTVTVPAGLQVESAGAVDWTCVVDGTIGCLRDPGMGVGASETISVVVVPTWQALGQQVVGATIETAGDIDDANDSAAASITVTGVEDVEIEIARAGDLLESEQASYDVIVSNAGTIPTSEQLQVAGSLPQGVAIDGVSAAGWTCDVGVSGYTCVWTDSVEVGEEAGPITITVTPTVTAPDEVVHGVTVTLGTDQNGQNDQASDVGEVGSREVPDPVLREMWPPNHQLHTFTLADCVALSPSCPTLVSGHFVAASADELADTGGKNHQTDIIFNSCTEVQLRSERLGGGDGRAYELEYDAVDSCGRSLVGACTISVPHDRGGDEAVGSGTAYSVASPSCTSGG